MARMTVRKVDEIFIWVSCDSATHRYELKDAFSYYVPDYFHMWKYQQGIWDGKVSLYSLKTQTTYLGLLPKVLEFAKLRNIEVDIIEDDFNLATPYDLDQFWKAFSNHSEYELRDYQAAAINIASTEKKALFESATGSGKSLAIYALIKLIDKPTLLIVPSLHLVGQMYSDFAKYGAKDPNFKIEEWAQQIHGGETKVVSKQVVISTWHSIYKQPMEYFDRFQCVIGDECHEDKAEKLRQLIEKCTKSEFRYGFTATLDGTITNETILKGLFGNVHVISTAHELMERGLLAKITINQIILQYSDATRKAMNKKDYKAEVEFLTAHPARSMFIAKLGIRCPGNTLILFQRVEKHGKQIFELLKQINDAGAHGKQIFFIHGKIGKKERERIVNVMEQGDGVIIVASLGTFSRGVNVKNLENVIFAFGLKSEVTTRQAAGRGVRIGRSDKVSLFDLSDDLVWKAWTNYSLEHGMKRLKIYQRERFDYKVIKVKLE